MKQNKGFPNKLTAGQMSRYRDMQKAENFPGGLNIRAGNEMGFKTAGKPVMRGADKPGTYGSKLRKG